MREAIEGWTSVFLDSAPIIYHVEAHPNYAAPMRAVFERVDRGELGVVTASPAGEERVTSESMTSPWTRSGLARTPACRCSTRSRSSALGARGAMCSSRTTAQ